MSSIDTVEFAGHQGSAGSARAWTAVLLIALIGLAVYARYATGPALVYDDWDVCHFADDGASFWQTYTSWFPKFSIRPLAPLLLAGTAQVFHWWMPGYLLTTLSFWALAIAMLGKLLARYFGVRAAVVFALLALFPSMSSTLVFNTGMQLVGTFSMLLWAVSLTLVDCSCRSQRPWGWLAASWAVLAITFLIYELILPLLVFNFLWPLACSASEGRIAWRKIDRAYIVRYAVPLAVIVGAVMLVQVVVLPRFWPSETRLRLSPANAVASAGSWFLAVGLQYPSLLLDGAARFAPVGLRYWPELVVIAAALGGLAFLGRDSGDEPSQAEPYGPVRGTLWRAAWLALLSCALLYFLTGRTAVVWGFGNRGLTPAWTVIAWLVGMATTLYQRRPIVLALAALLVALNLWSFLVQRNNYLECAATQQQVVDAAVASVQGESEFLPGSVLLANVPCYVTTNYNDEFLFYSQRDFGLAVEVRSQGRIGSGVVFAAETLRNGRIAEITPTEITVNHLPLLTATYERLWYFEYDQKTRQTRLLKVRDEAHLRELIEQVSTSEVNKTSAPTMQKLIYNLRDAAKARVRKPKPAAVDSTAPPAENSSSSAAAP